MNTSITQYKTDVLSNVVARSLETQKCSVTLRDMSVRNINSVTKNALTTNFCHWVQSNVVRSSCNVPYTFVTGYSQT